MAELKALKALYSRVDRDLPSALGDWGDRVHRWCEDYQADGDAAMIVEINLDLGVFLFDQALERVILAYGISCAALHVRDKGRMRGFPKVDEIVRLALREQAFPADRGHFLGHASGGELDINLFPQSRSLNRGRSAEGKLFRKMETFVAANPGTFFFHRAQYCDETWIPAALEYGALREDREWWIQNFNNRC